MKKLTKFWVGVALFLLPLIAVHAQENQDSEKIQQWLNIYLDQDDQSIEGNPILHNETLRNAGIDLIPFSEGILSNVLYEEFWKEALDIYVAAKYTDNQFVELADKLIQWLERKESVYDSKVILFKMQCVNFLHQLVGPNFFQNPDLENKILAFADRFFQTGEPTRPEYWFQKFGITELAQRTKESFTTEESDTIMWAECTARVCVLFAGTLYNATNDNRYSKIVEDGLQSDYVQIQVTSKFILTDRSRSEWQSGEYELFAALKNRLPISPEELARLKKVNQGITGSRAPRKP